MGLLDKAKEAANKAAAQVNQATGSSGAQSQHKAAQASFDEAVKQLGVAAYDLAAAGQLSHPNLDPHVAAVTQAQQNLAAAQAQATAPVQRPPVPGAAPAGQPMEAPVAAPPPVAGPAPAYQAPPAAPPAAPVPPTAAPAPQAPTAPMPVAQPAAAPQAPMTSPPAAAPAPEAPVAPAAPGVAPPVVPPPTVIPPDPNVPQQ